MRIVFTCRITEKGLTYKGVLVVSVVVICNSGGASEGVYGKVSDGAGPVCSTTTDYGP